MSSGQFFWSRNTAWVVGLLVTLVSTHETHVATIKMSTQKFKLSPRRQTTPAENHTEFVIYSKQDFSNFSNFYTTGIITNFIF